MITPIKERVHLIMCLFVEGMVGAIIIIVDYGLHRLLDTAGLSGWHLVALRIILFGCASLALCVMMIRDVWLMAIDAVAKVKKKKKEHR